LNLSEFELFAIKTSKEAGLILSSYFGKVDILDTKSTQVDLLTEADLNSEDAIIKSINATYPNHNIITEESDIDNTNSDFCWVIDPLDGTTNFVHKLPIFAVSIALQFKGQTIAAAVYNPMYDQCFHATKNGGAFLNKNPIKTTSCNTLSESLLVTGFPYIHDQRWALSFDLFKDIYSRNHGIRRLGAAALDFCFVAMGRFDAFYEFELKPWDVCAGDLIVREAGGETSDWDGKLPMPSCGKRVLASNGKIHNELIEILTLDKYKIFMI
tara:strand:- start:957 stop:1763 length:807 start_codon:yes stop_codon:yes gene_type:complete